MCYDEGEQSVMKAHLMMSQNYNLDEDSMGQEGDLSQTAAAESLTLAVMNIEIEHRVMKNI